MKDKTALTARQKRFVEEYLACGDAPEAAIAAGYSPAAAEERARALLRDPAVQRYRRETEQRLFDAMGVSSAWIGRRLVEIVERCMQATPHLTRNPETKQREPDGTEPIADVELLRLAMPRRVFTMSQVLYAVDRIAWLHENRELVGGLRWVEEPSSLRFFFGRLEPTSDWQDKLVAKFRADFGDSL